MYSMYGMYVQQLTIRQIFPSISFLENNNEKKKDEEGKKRTSEREKQLNGQ